jgi:D-3-phosphoglycerate dehydrogenase
MLEKKKIILTDEPHPYLISHLEQIGFECLEHYETPRAEVLALLPQCFGLLVRSRLQVDRPLLDAGQQLSFIARYGVGTEHIDLDYAAELGIPVFTSPEGSRDTVAEHSMGMLLMLMNYLGRADREVRNNLWKRGPNRGVEIKGKTVGILGYGNMGKALAQRLQGFEAEVLTFDKYKKNYGDSYAKQVSLEELQAKADIVSLHIPYEKDNHYFIDQTFIEACAKPFYLVNTARGLVLNTADLVQGLEDGKVLGAALDVLEYEEMSFAKLDLSTLPAPFQYLKQADNVVLSPHIAGWSLESKLGHAQTLAQKIEALVSR